MKAAHILVAIAFETGCFGLWVVMRIMAMLHRAHPFPQHHGGKLSPGDFQIFCASHSDWLPYLGIPAVVFALIAAIRGTTTPETFSVFASLLSLAFVVLFFTVAAACLVSWIAVYD